jgi:TRAP-type C4-dicarboxylate transport system permease small subunit
MRKFFGTSIGGADELAGYALALGTAWSLGATLLDRAHIRIDSLYVMLPRRLRLVLDFVGLALFVWYFGLITWRGWSMVQQSWASTTRSQSELSVPTVIPQALWLLGMAVFVATGAALFVQALVLVMRGRGEAAARLIGTRSAEEEVQDEISDLKARQTTEAGH